MSNFATNNFILERKIIEKLYFDNIQELSETHQVKNRPCTVTYVSLNNVPYLLYSYKFITFKCIM